jgi:NAD-dependent deacetylase
VGEWVSGLLPEICQEINCAAGFIRQARRGVALTGAGISTPSGIPDFRSAGSGLWNRYNPLEVASLRAFRYRPERFYAWMRSLAREIVQAQPNPAHYGLTRLEQGGYLRAIITQNVDGLHQRSGARRVLEVHGSIQVLTCIGCYRQFEARGFIEPYIENGDIPRCPECHDVLKPNIILFEEQLPMQVWQQAKEACESSDVCIVVGSSLEVMPVAGLPMQALENGARLIIVNHSPTYIDVRADAVIRGNVAEVIPQIALEVMGV